MIYPQMPFDAAEGHAGRLIIHPRRCEAGRWIIVLNAWGYPTDPFRVIEYTNERNILVPLQTGRYIQKVDDVREFRTTPPTFAP